MLLTLAYQRTWLVPLNIGVAEGMNNDTPFLRGFHDPESVAATSVRYRWTTPNAALYFRNAPQRAYLLTLYQINGNPAQVGLAAADTSLPLSSGRVLRMLLPPTDADLNVTLKATQPLTPAGDPRQLGVALQGGTLQTLGAGALPPLLPLLAWSGALLTLTLTVVWLGGSVGEMLLLGAVLGTGTVMATWVAPLRVGYAAGAIGQTTLYGLGFALVARWLFPHIVGWVQPDPERKHAALQLDPRALRWLVLAATLVWSLKLGGRLVPGTMPGDIGFHRNRVWAQQVGNLFNPSLHRGVPFPYPPALYALLAPLTTTGYSPEWLLQMAAAACEALALPFIFGLVWHVRRSERAGLFAAILYGIFPATFMTVAWSFNSHIFAQFVTLVWSVLLIRCWGRWHERRCWWLITGGLTLISLSHFGFYINSSLLAALLVSGLWFSQKRYLRSKLARRSLSIDSATSLVAPRQWLALGVSLLATQLIVWVGYYSAFFDLFVNQGRAVSAGGMDAVNNSAPLSRAALLWDILSSGFWKHYVLLPLVLAPFGWWLLWRADARSRSAALVLGATFAVSLALGSLPILTAVPLTTRWLMFSAWALAACSGIALDYIWTRTRTGRWLALASTMIVAAYGISLWLQAVIYRIRPPEPF